MGEREHGEEALQGHLRRRLGTKRALRRLKAWAARSRPLGVVAVEAQRRKFQNKRQKKASEVRATAAVQQTWKCRRCGAANLMLRWNCHQCSQFVDDDDWYRAARSQGKDWNVEEQRKALTQLSQRRRLDVTLISYCTCHGEG